MCDQVLKPHSLVAVLRLGPVTVFTHVCAVHLSTAGVLQDMEDMTSKPGLL